MNSSTGLSVTGTIFALAGAYALVGLTVTAFFSFGFFTLAYLIGS